MKTRFPWRLWNHTLPHENLFDLTPEELKIFKTLCAEASC